MLCSILVNSQTKKEKKAYLDSLENLLTTVQRDSLYDMLNGLENMPQKDILDVSVTLYNGQLSKTSILTNKSETYNGALITPNLIYTFKSGISFTYENIIAMQSSNTVLLQHTVTLGYDYLKSENFIFGFFANKNFTKDSSLYDATLFDYGIGLNFKYFNSYVQPLCTITFDRGKFKEKIKLPISSIVRTFNATIQSFSSTIGVQHSYDFENRLGGKWDINFTPKVLMLLASQKYATDMPARRKRLPSQTGASNAFIQRNITDKFQIQSVGVELDATFSKGNFYIMPNLYIDYGVNIDATTKRLFAVGGLTFGYTF